MNWDIAEEKENWRSCLKPALFDGPWVETGKERCTRDLCNDYVNQNIFSLSYIICDWTTTVAQGPFISENTMVGGVKKNSVEFAVFQQVSTETTFGLLACISLSFQMEIFLC